MNFHIEGTRPPSARPQSRINPITGEEMPVSARGNVTVSTHPAASKTKAAQHQGHPITHSKSHFRPDRPPENRPKGVPKLHLGKLGDQHDDLDLTLHMDPYTYKLNSPGAESSVSWGTPTSIVRQDLKKPIESARMKNGANHRAPGQSSRKDNAVAKNKQSSAWEREKIVPEDLPPPSQRYQDQYAQLQQDMKDSYRNQSSRSITESEVFQKIEELKLDVPSYEPPEDDDEKDQLQKSWTDQPYSKATQLRRADKESLEDENRRKKLLETVMIDQLSRPVISCPEQNSLASSRSQKYRPRSRQAPHTQRDSSRLSSATTPTENLLSRRVSFGARVITRVGRDAIRELTGFYFAVDNSLTVYEFKKFGKTAKALPFIKRGVYNKPKGLRRGEPYQLNNIKQGDCILMETKDQPVPDSMKSSAIATLKITHVDDEAKANILLEGVHVADQDDVWRRAHIPQSKEEVNARLLQVQVHDCVRKQIQKRGLKVYTGLYKHFCKLDEGQDGQLNRVELEKGLIDFHVEVPQENFDDLWEVLDVDCTSFMDYGDFMRGFLGEMPEGRKALVIKVFLKIDPGKRGEVTFDDIKKFYNAYKHPRVKSGECSEEEILQNFLSHFGGSTSKKLITFFEFENYYEGLSVCVPSDEDFANILQNAWSI